MNFRLIFVWESRNGCRDLRSLLSNLIIARIFVLGEVVTLRYDIEGTKCNVSL